MKGFGVTELATTLLILAYQANSNDARWLSNLNRAVRLRPVAHCDSPGLHSIRAPSGRIHPLPCLTQQNETSQVRRAGRNRNCVTNQRAEQVG